MRTLFVSLAASSLRDHFGSPFDSFTLTSASMTTCDGQTHNVRVGDVVHLLDDNETRVFNITPPPGPVVLKRNNHTTYRSFLRAPSQLFISAPRSPYGPSVHADCPTTCHYR